MTGRRKWDASVAPVETRTACVDVWVCVCELYVYKKILTQWDIVRKAMAGWTVVAICLNRV